MSVVRDGIQFVLRVDQATLDGMYIALGHVDGDILNPAEYRGVKTVLEQIRAVVPRERIEYLNRLCLALHPWFLRRRRSRARGVELDEKGSSKT